MRRNATAAKFQAGSAGAGNGGPNFGGDLASLSALELLQVLSFTRRSGRVDLTTTDSELATCELAAGKVVAARCGHLDGYEAALELMSWQEGTFEFRHSNRPIEVSDRGFEVASLTLETARLADELERRGESLPSDEARLVLRADAPLPEDELEVSLAEVRATLAGDPGMSLDQLRDRVGLCAAKVELAVAVLNSAGCLSVDEPKRKRTRVERVSAWPPANDASAPAAGFGVTLRQRYPRGLRLLVALAPELTHVELAPVLDRLRELFGTPSLTLPSLALAPLFARFRPNGGGSVSFTFLPVQKQNRFLFDGFSSSVDFVFVPLDAGDEGAVWREHLPADASFQLLERSPQVLATLLSRLELLVGPLAGAGAPAADGERVER